MVWHWSLPACATSAIDAGQFGTAIADGYDVKVLLVGGGGREHALAWKLAQAPGVTQVFVAPGNVGTHHEAKVSNVEIGVEDIEGLKRFAIEQQVIITIVGPEAPLVAGIVDVFRAADLRIFGPSREAAQLEGSKAFTKDFLQRHAIPAAASKTFADAAKAKAYIADRALPVVIKADGLAAGKGVIIATTFEQAYGAVDDMLLAGRFGEAGQRVLVEDFLAGEEASFIAIVGGGHILALASSQDHKARDDGDKGPNTGGMGAYSPAPIVDDAMHEHIMATVMAPTVAGLAAEGIDYTGFLYAGLMIDEAGVARVLEFNCRFGDPETQPILMRLQSDLLQACEAALDGTLNEHRMVWSEQVALGVVMAAEGYPGAYSSGDKITGLDNVSEHSKVFHAGTALDADGAYSTAGGRVLCVCALGDTVADAQRRAYNDVDAISWRGAFCRRDIGYRALAREQR